MDIRVSGHQIDTGEALQNYVADRLNTMVEKYFNRALSSQVTFGKGAHGAFTSDIVTHVNKGLILKSHGDAQDVHLSFDQAAEKLDKQLRRYKRRLKDHHRDRQAPIEATGAPSYILAGEAEDAEEEPATLQPVIVAEMETRVPLLSVGEAVMQMELAGAHLLVFRNTAHGGVNVVHRRDDGNIGWIDPRNTQ